MNTSLAGQTTSRSEERKRKYREIDLKGREQLRVERLAKKDPESLKRAIVEQRVRERLEGSPVACDLLISLFATALFSYRRGTVCEPFPHEFSDRQGEKDYASAEVYTQALPSIEHFQKHQGAITNLPASALKLLSWIIDLPYYEELDLEQISLDQYREETMNIDSKQSKYSDPAYVFKVTYTEQHPTFPIFEKAKAEFGSTMGFHGSPFENFHSILRNGLDATFGKETSLFGDGIYLSSDRDVAFSFLKNAKNFAKNSALGDRLGCLVCAEVACKPQVVRLSPQEANIRNLSDNADPELPRGYIVVGENEYVCIKYILLYKNFGTFTEQGNSPFCHVLQKRRIAFCQFSFCHLYAY
eukprot:TRINITY_DN5980_c0_g1_i2.p1 TRINITY_DN5980_c0_g1~~TRINITY_DN5980_c0_g1_i2.p1  ORF type:complete len:357 (-),score=55.16 TRINITY_DN5980_c0_g1_i2:57-1127(-)